MVVVAGRGELAARWLAMEFGVIAVVGWGVEDGWEEGVGRCLVVDGVGVAILAVKDTLGTSCRLREVHSVGESLHFLHCSSVAEK